MSTRIKVFVIAVCVIVTGQVIYSIQNVKSFQNSYLETLQEKTGKLGGYLKDDVEYVLNLNIPLEKLVKMERTLKEILVAIPELEFVEITDMAGYVLYYADHERMRRVEPATLRSGTGRKREETTYSLIGLSPDDVVITLPVFHQRENQQVGFINMRLSPNLIVEKSTEILLDMITVIMTSLLITFELLTFFVSYSVSRPLENVVQEVETSIGRLSPLSGRSFLFMSELGNVIERFNHYMLCLNRTLGPHISTQKFFPEIRSSFTGIIQRQLGLIRSLPSSARLPLDRMQNRLLVLQDRMDSFFHRLSGQRFRFGVPEGEQPEAILTGQQALLPYTYIRPLIFLFIMADGFCTSFFPMFVETLYEPVLGLSREVIIGLPISVFMFCLAVSMPLSGGVADAWGWYRPLMAGIFLNACGLVLTALSQNIYQLILFRAITAVGFGLTYMSCQQFIIDNTTARSRALGLATFLAAFFSGDICGTVVGGMLADRIGYRNVFLVSGIISSFALISGLLIFRQDIRPQRRKRTKRMKIFPFGDALRVIRDREFMTVILLQAIPAKLILVGFLFYLVPIYLNSIGTLQSNIGRVIMCYGIMLVFMGPLFSRYFNRASHRKYYILTGGVITGLAMMSFFAFSGFLPLLLVVALLGIAHTFSVSSQASLISETEIVNTIGVGTGMGLFRFWERVGNVSGPLVVGYMTAKLGYEKTIGILGIYSLSCSFLFLVVLSFTKSKLSSAKRGDEYSFPPSDIKKANDRQRKLRHTGVKQNRDTSALKPTVTDHADEG